MLDAGHAARRRAPQPRPATPSHAQPRPLRGALGNRSRRARVSEPLAPAARASPARGGRAAHELTVTEHRHLACGQSTVARALCRAKAQERSRALRGTQQECAGAHLEARSAGAAARRRPRARRALRACPWPCGARRGGRARRRARAARRPRRRRQRRWPRTRSCRRSTTMSCSSPARPRPRLRRRRTRHSPPARRPRPASAPARAAQHVGARAQGTPEHTGSVFCPARRRASLRTARPAARPNAQGRGGAAGAQARASHRLRGSVRQRRSCCATSPSAASLCRRGSSRHLFSSACSMSYEPALAVRAAAAAAAPAPAGAGWGAFAAPAGAPAPSLGAEAARGTPAARDAAAAGGGRRRAGCGGVGGPGSRFVGALSTSRTCRCGAVAAERIPGVAGAAAGASGAASPAVRALAPLVTGCASRSAATTAATRSSVTAAADGAGPGSPAPGHAVALACSGVACARGCRGVSVCCPRCSHSRRSPWRDALAGRACASKGTLPSRLVCKPHCSPQQTPW